MIDPTLSVIYSELVLSLYPIVVKTVKTNLFTQTLARFIVYPILALSFGPWKDFANVWNTPYESFVGMMHGVLNLTHVAVSFISFKLLPAGAAISLFYLYPIINAIAAHFLFGDTLPTYSIILFGMALLGTYLIANAQLDKAKIDGDKQKYKSNFYGIITGIMAAITESIIYIFVRSNKLASASPYYTMNHLYPGGLVILLLMAIFSDNNIISTNSVGWGKLIAFNAILGFTGYMARFYSIPKLPAIIFSILSFIGVISAYVWGAIFTGERPSRRGIVGGSLIAGSIALLRYFQ